VPLGELGTPQRSQNRIRGGLELTQRSSGIGLAANVATDDLGLDGVQDLVNISPPRRYRALVLAQGGDDGSNLSGRNRAQPGERLFADDLLDPTPRDVGVAGNGKVGGTLGKGCSGRFHLLGCQDLRQALKQGGSVPPRPPFELRGQDVDAGLAQTALEGKFVFALPALIPHDPELVDGCIAEVRDVAGIGDSLDEPSLLLGHYA
jgi:hypothetical protein